MVVDQFARANQVRGVLAVQDHDQSDDAGPFAIAHAVRVLENSQAPELVRNFKKLGLEDALAVFANANATERKTLRPLLQAQAERAVIAQDSDSAKYTPEEWQALAKRIRTAMATKHKAPKAATSGWAGKIPFLPSNAAGSTVPLTPPAH